MRPATGRDLGVLLAAAAICDVLGHPDVADALTRLVRDLRPHAHLEDES